MVFDVGRGQCIALRTPNNHLILIDCGSSDTFSPATYLAACGSFWTGRHGHALTKLIVTHPHTDHIADIERISAHLTPSIILRRSDLDRTRIGGSNGNSAAYEHYARNYLPPEYNASIPPSMYPDWGERFSLRSYSLSEPIVRQVSTSDNAYVNNSSFVTVVKYGGYTIVFSGDIESDGLRELLHEHQDLGVNIIKTRDLFGHEVCGVDFLVAPHHGHPSGFSTTWFDWAGPTRIFNVVSERRLRPGENASRAHVDTRYSDAQYSLAMNREGRRMVSTRADGHISITINDDGTWNWQGVRI